VAISRIVDVLPGSSDRELQCGPTTIVKQDASLTNDPLSTAQSHAVASAILNHLEATYGGTKDALPQLPDNTRRGSAMLLGMAVATCRAPFEKLGCL